MDICTKTLFRFVKAEINYRDTCHKWFGFDYDTLLKKCKKQFGKTNIVEIYTDCVDRNTCRPANKKGMAQSHEAYQKRMQTLEKSKPIRRKEFLAKYSYITDTDILDFLTNPNTKYINGDVQKEFNISIITFKKICRNRYMVDKKKDIINVIQFRLKNKDQ